MNEKYNKNSRRKNHNNQVPREKQRCNPDKDPISSKKRDYAGNHIQWYVPDPNLLGDVASIPFNYRLGDPVPGTFIGKNLNPAPEMGFNHFAPGKFCVPGICAINYTPTFGDLSGPDSPGNVASTAVYSWVRHANSGARNYDAVDLMMYLMAMDSIHSGLAWCQRLIATVMSYNARNRYTPGALIKISGVSTSLAELSANLPYMRNRLNQMILKATTLAVPKTLPIYDRHTFMNSNVYVDEPNTRGQFYIFNPKNLWQFNMTSSGLPRLQAIPFCQEHGRPFTAMFDDLDACINQLYADEDAGIMSGDILKAYGESNLFSLVTVPSDIVLVPVYDHELLEQIHNATAWGDIVKDSLTPIHDVAAIEQVFPQDSNSPYLNNRFTFKKAMVEEKDKVEALLLDLHSEPTPEMVMRSTRLMTWVSKSSTDIPSVKSTFSSEVVNDFSIVRINASNDYDIFKWEGLNSAMDMHPGDDLWKFILSSSTFSLAPIVYIPWNTQTAQGDTEFVPYGNLDRFTQISISNMTQLNQVATLGLFNVPRLTLGQTSNS